MFGKSRFLAAMLAGLALSLGGLAFGQEGEKHKSDPAPEDIKQDKPSFLVRADVNHANRSYREGDSLTITARRGMPRAAITDMAVSVWLSVPR